MFEILDRQKNLTGNQIRILVAAIFGGGSRTYQGFLLRCAGA
jgi:hypothetical protein